MKSKTTAIVQARIGSTRLPRKIFLDLAGKSILCRVLDRIRFCKKIDSVVVATTEEIEDSEVLAFVSSSGHGATCFRGSTNDVLDRYYKAAAFSQTEWIVRITSDSPLIDPEVVDFVIGTAQNGLYDYVSNSILPTMPDGLDVECFTANSLDRAWHNALKQPEREHVTPYLRMNPDKFKLANVFYRNNYSSQCWAIDTYEDLLFMRELASVLNLDRPENMSFIRIAEILSLHPEISVLNKSSKRDIKLLEELPDIFSSDSGNITQYEFKPKTMIL